MAPIPPLAQELPHAAGVALKIKKKKKGRKRKRKKCWEWGRATHFSILMKTLPHLLSHRLNQIVIYGVGGMYENSQRVHTSCCKINESWVTHVTFVPSKFAKEQVSHHGNCLLCSNLDIQVD